MGLYESEPDDDDRQALGLDACTRPHECFYFCDFREKISVAPTASSIKVTLTLNAASPKPILMHVKVCMQSRSFVARRSCQFEHN